MKHNDSSVIFPDTKIQLDLPFAGYCLQYHPPIFRKADDGTMIVGYLGTDEDSPNPMEDYDGEGKIYSFSRRHCNFKTLDEVLEEHAKVPKHLIVPLSSTHHGLCHCPQRTTVSASGASRAAVCTCRTGTRAAHAGVWVPHDDCTMDNLMAQVDAHMLPKDCKVEYRSKCKPDGTSFTRPPKPGETPYFADGSCIDERYSNVITLILPDGSEYHGFKSFRSAYRSAYRRLGIKIDKEVRKQAETEAAKAYAEGVCKTYTAWCNGEVYVTVVAWYDPDTYEEIDHDTCVGYFDQKSADEDLLSNVESELKRLNKLADETLIAAATP